MGSFGDRHTHRQAYSRVRILRLTTSMIRSGSDRNMYVPSSQNEEILGRSTLSTLVAGWWLCPQAMLSPAQLAQREGDPSEASEAVA